MRFALIGKDIDYSLSPKLNSMIYRQLDINCSYSIQNIKLENIRNIVDMLKSNHLNGINITIPYKTTFFDFIDYLDPLSKSIMSVNCINFHEGIMKGYNTDIYGFENLIRVNNVDMNSKNILVLGAGGGAKAVCFYLKSCRYNFYIYNRSELNAKELSRLLFNDTSCALNKNEPIHNIDIVINCLPRSIEPFDFLNKSCIEISDLSYFIDINYNTKFSKLNGVKIESTINGVDMLIYQAIKSNEIWLGTNILDRLDVKYIKENLTEN